MTLPVFIPFSRIPADTLQGLLEDFATRAGTDYGEKELTLDVRVELIRRQLDGGGAVLVYSPMDESLQIVTLEEAKAFGYVRNADS